MPFKSFPVEKNYFLIFLIFFLIFEIFLQFFLRFGPSRPYPPLNLRFPTSPPLS